MTYDEAYKELKSIIEELERKRSSFESIELFIQKSERFQELYAFCTQELHQASEKMAKLNLGVK